MDQPGILGDRHETVRRQIAMHRVMPAGNGIEAGDGATAQVEIRTEAQVQPVGVECRPQIALQRLAQSDLLVHVGLEKPIGRPAFSLRPIERDIGATQRLCQIGRILWQHGDADAGADGMAHAAGGDRFIADAHQTAGKAGRGFRAGQML